MKYKVKYQDRNYVVTADSHIEAADKVRRMCDARIKDFDEKPYLNELSKLAVEGQRLNMLRHKIVEFFNDNPANQTDWINNAKVKQWVKQARQLGDKWNRITKILVDKFNLGTTYLYQPGNFDEGVWFATLPEQEHVNYIKNAIQLKREREERLKG